MAKTIELTDLLAFAVKKALEAPEDVVNVMDGSTWLTSQWAGSVLTEAAGHPIETFSNFYTVSGKYSNVLFKIPEAYREWNSRVEFSWILWTDMVDILEDMIKNEEDYIAFGSDRTF